MKNDNSKLKLLSRKIKWGMHRIRIWVALFLGIKKSKMAKLVDCTLYELRIMALVTVLIFGFYLIADSLITEDESEVFKLLIKFNCLVVLVIIGLMVKILVKVTQRNKCKHPDHCFKHESHYHWSHPEHRNLNDRPKCDCPHEHK